MASEGPDDAIPTQGSANNETWGENGGYGSAENESEQYSHHQTQDPSISVDPAYNASGEPPEDDADSGEYDPESVTITTVAAPVVEASSSNASPRPSKKPKKAGGFLVGSSDDEDDSPTPPVSSGLKPDTFASNIQSQHLTHSPLQQSVISQDLPSVANPPLTQVINGAQTNPGFKAHLPADATAILEDRIKNDPRGDLDAWLALIDEHRRRNMINDARAVYERFFEVFPQSAEIWVQYLEMELSLDNFAEAERIFQRTLMSISSVQLWTAYLDYIRRRNDLNDTSGQARQTVNSAYEFVLDNIGQDRDSGRIWQDYIHFIKSGPGQVGGSNWQDMQKMDVLRKAYQRAICIPMFNLNTLWKEYDQFELGLNKVAGRKFLQERSPSYMSARSANTHLDNLTRGLQRTTLPRLPPAPGFDGDHEYLEQVELWKKWIAWEKDDPLVLKADEPETYKARVIYVYKQALMALRFWPELWVDASEWCFENGIVSKEGQELGLQFLVDGVGANPESSLLAFKHADRIESTHPAGEGEAGKTAFAEAVRAPFEVALSALYNMVKKLKEQEEGAIERIKHDPSLTVLPSKEEEDEGEISDKSSPEDARKDRIKAVQDGFAVQVQLLSQHITSLWIALARAWRRIQGQGKSQPPSGIRGIFTQSRARGRLTSEMYVAIAHIEWDIYQDPVATKIFERGAKLFPEDEHFMVSYLKHLHARHDTTNARVVFSQVVKRFKENPVLTPKLKPLYSYFHNYEAKFGELAQIKELEKQMAESFPEDPILSQFAARFSSDRFNPITATIIVSPTSQMRPKHIIQSVERASASVRGSPHLSVALERSPRPQFLPAVNSPKRPFQDDADELNPPRKLARGASPLKGAAGRRLDQQRRAAQNQGISSHSATPAPISRDITFLLGLIPPVHQYDAQRYRPDAIARIIRDTPVPDFNEWKASGRQIQQISRAHTRQVSTDYSHPAYGSRDSPAPGSRNSPFPRGGSARGPPPTYGVEPSDDYEPPPGNHVPTLPYPGAPQALPPGYPSHQAPPPQLYPSYNVYQ
ncbi:CFIA complex component Rna14 [Xylariales sp. PMI_506]|nr:CFIA complex component Rna14 [Xylariales sp. PMI_506]